MEKVFCDIQGKESFWIQVTDKVSIRKWNDWRSADYEKTLELIPGFILDWNLVDENGKPVSVQNFLDADVVFMHWLTGAITNCIIERMKLPEKNLSGSQSAQTNKT